MPGRGDLEETHPMLGIRTEAKSHNIPPRARPRHQSGRGGSAHCRGIEKSLSLGMLRNVSIGRLQDVDSSLMADKNLCLHQWHGMATPFAKAFQKFGTQ